MKWIHTPLALALLLAVAIIVPGCKDSHSPHSNETGNAHKDHDDHDHDDHADHAGHDHGSEKTSDNKKPKEHDDHDKHDDHKGHDHSSQTADKHDDHANHDDHKDEDKGHVDEVTLTPQAIKRWNITLAKAQKITLTNHLTVPARVSYDLQSIAHVGSLASGKISELGVRIGDNVKQGQPLCQIISPELGQAQSDFMLKQSAIGAAQASLRVAQTLHQNAKKLHEESQGIALSEVQKREVDVLALQGSLKASQGARDAARNLLVLLGMDDQAIEQLDKTGKVNPVIVITAPIAGRVIERFASLGESVGPDHDALFVIANMEKLWIIADVPESLADQVQLGAHASIWPITDQPTIIQSEVTFIATELSSRTRTLAMRMEIDQTTSKLRPGMFVKVELTTHSQDEPVLAVPEAAVQMVENESCVFVPVPGELNTFAKRPVKLGPAVGRNLPVLAGLAEGEAFVATGTFMLKADLGKAGAAHEH